MAPAEPNVDYYAVLEISNIATIELVTKSYRRLAKLRHPDKNPSADSTAVFQLVKQPLSTFYMSLLYIESRQGLTDSW